MRATEITLYNILEKKDKYSKQNDLFYCELKMQKYLLLDNMSVKQAKIVFSFRTRMALFSENYRGKTGPATCPLCQVHLDNQPMSFKCKVLKDSVNINGKYENTFNENIHTELAETLQNILKFREANI